MSSAELVSELLRTMPAINAAPETRAAWFRRKAETFEALADKSDSVVEAFECREAAEEARRRADECQPCGLSNDPFTTCMDRLDELNVTGEVGAA